MECKCGFLLLEVLFLFVCVLCAFARIVGVRAQLIRMTGKNSGQVRSKVGMR